MTNGKVYAVRGAGAFVKIGYTTDLGSRLQNLQTGSPVELELLGWVEGTLDNERGLHHRFRHRRTAGEWFSLSDDEVEELRRHLDGDRRVTHLPKAGRRAMLPSRRRRT